MKLFSPKKRLTEEEAVVLARFYSYAIPTSAMVFVDYFFDKIFPKDIKSEIGKGMGSRISTVRTLMAIEACFYMMFEIAVKLEKYTDEKTMMLFGERYKDQFIDYICSHFFKQTKDNKAEIRSAFIEEYANATEEYFKTTRFILPFFERLNGHLKRNSISIDKKILYKYMDLFLQELQNTLSIDNALKESKRLVG